MEVCLGREAGICQAVARFGATRVYVGAKRYATVLCGNVGGLLCMSMGTVALSPITVIPPYATVLVSVGLDGFFPIASASLPPVHCHNVSASAHPLALRFLWCLLPCFPGSAQFASMPALHYCMVSLLHAFPVLT